MIASNISIENTLSLKIDKDFKQVSFDEVYFVEAMGNYMKVHLKDKNLVTYSSLKSMQEMLPKERFVKVQKSFIVAKDKIERIIGNFIQIDGKKISMSRSYRNEILSAIS